MNGILHLPFDTFLCSYNVKTVERFCKSFISAAIRSDHERFAKSFYVKKCKLLFG